MGKKIVKLLILSISMFNNLSFAKHKEIQNEAIQIKFNKLNPICSVDERYQSVNVEMCEIVGGDFWIPYELMDTIRPTSVNSLKRKILPINLYNDKLRMLTSALGPQYIRVSGTWANTTYFQDNDEPKLKVVPKGYENVLTRAEWKGVVDFCKATDSKLVTSFAICDGIRDSNGDWTSAQAGPLINYTKSIGGEIAAAEMFNEPSHAGFGGAPAGYKAINFAQDFKLFKSFIDSAAPDMKILGPGSIGEPKIMIGGSIKTDDVFLSEPKPIFDIFSYHYYGWVSKRCGGNLTPESAMNKDWLSKTELGLEYYNEARNKYNPGVPIWLTETAEAACGGNPWASTFVDCFRYLEQLGRLAKKGVQVVMHNTLCVSEYGLLDQETYEPRPNYWAALLWHKFMGTKVYDAGVSENGLDIYIHNLNNSENGFAVMIINPNKENYQIKIPSKAKQYLLTADGSDLETKKVKLNGNPLSLNSDEKLPEIVGAKVKSAKIIVPSFSILFLTYDNH